MVTVKVMNDLLPHPLCNVNRPSHSEIQLFQNLTMKSMFKVMCVVIGQGHVWPWNFKGQDYGQGQTHWSHLRPGLQSICFLFVSWQSGHFWLRYRKFHIWPWKFKVKVMAKVKPDGHIWALESNRYIYFSFRGNRTIFGWDIAIPYVTLKNLGQDHNENRPKSYQVIYRSGPTIMPKMKEIQKVVQKLSHGQKLRPAASAAYEPVQKHKVTPGMPGWLNNDVVITSK